MEIKFLQTQNKKINDKFSSFGGSFIHGNGHFFNYVVSFIS